MDELQEMLMSNISDMKIEIVPDFTVYGILKESVRIFSLRALFFIGFGAIAYCSVSFFRELSYMIDENIYIQKSIIYLPLRLVMRLILESIPIVIQVVLTMKILFEFYVYDDLHIKQKTTMYPFVIAKHTIIPIIFTLFLCLLFDKFIFLATIFDIKYRTFFYITSGNRNVTYSFFRYIYRALQNIVMHIVLFGAIAANDEKLQFNKIIPYCVKLLKRNYPVFFLLLFVRTIFVTIFAIAMLFMFNFIKTIFILPKMMEIILKFLIDVPIVGFDYVMFAVIYCNLKAIYLKKG
jgi:hypothetical protein